MEADAFTAAREGNFGAASHAQADFGVNDGLGLILLSLSKTCHAPFAATVTAFSKYLMGLCMLCRLPAGREAGRP